MEQQDVLEQVATARTRVGEAITLIEHRRDEAEAVAGKAAERLTHLQSAFNEFQSHLQSEGARATTAFQELVETLTTAGKTLHTEADARGADGHAFQGDLAAQQAALGDDTHSLEELIRLTAQQAQERHALRAELTQEVHERGGAHGQALDEHLVQGSQQRSEQVKSQGEQQHGRVQGELDHQLTPAKDAFAELVSERSQHAQEMLRTRTEALHDHADREVSKATSDEQQGRQDLRHNLDEMRQALEQLSKLATETSDVMVRGAEDASDLMNATNVGARTVIGLFNNLRDIFNEIESAWS